jgi:hypothetical protein
MDFLGGVLSFSVLTVGIDPQDKYDRSPPTIGMYEK